MPEQLTRHPEVTVQVLRSGGARCATGEAPRILRSCPAERFCALPGGEICVYGLAEAGQMTQIRGADWQHLAAAPPEPGTDWSGAAALGLGLLLGLALGRWRR